MPSTITESTFEFLATLLATSHTFREVMGVTTIGQARAKVHREEVICDHDPELDDESAPDITPLVQRPYAIVVIGNDRRERVGTGTWGGDGDVLVVIETLVPAAHLVDWLVDGSGAKRTKHQALYAWAEQQLQRIRDEMQERSGKDDGAGNPCLNATAIERYGSILLPDPEEPEQNWVSWAYEMKWF